MSAHNIIRGMHNECPTGKVAYPTRHDAKRQNKRIDGGHSKMRPYECPTCHLFHLGHLPAVVRLGDKSAEAYYGRRTRMRGQL